MDDTILNNHITGILDILFNTININEDFNKEFNDEFKKNIENELRIKLKNELPNILNPDSKKKTKKTKKVDDTVKETDDKIKNNFESKDEIEKLKINDIKEKLKSFGLKTTGKKEELINRIWEHISSNKEFVPNFTTNDNSRIKYGDLNDQWSHNMKYLGYELFGNYYKILPKLKREEDDIEKNLFFDKINQQFIACIESNSEKSVEDCSGYISYFEFSRNGKSKNLVFKFIKHENKENIEDLFENTDNYELIH